jgi:transcriptional/translational regulatory protein YebC/TACO1
MQEPELIYYDGEFFQRIVRGFGGNKDPFAEEKITIAFKHATSDAARLKKLLKIAKIIAGAYQNGLSERKANLLVFLAIQGASIGAIRRKIGELQNRRG